MYLKTTKPGLDPNVFRKVTMLDEVVATAARTYYVIDDAGAVTTTVEADVTDRRYEMGDVALSHETDS